MGTTVAALLVSRSRRQRTYATVGDSRIYLIRAGTIVQLTRDDTWLNAAWDGAALDSSTQASMKNVLTKALGSRQDVDFDVLGGELNDRDIVLLCSDGLTNMLSDAEILDIVTTHEPDLERACRQLVDAANAQGGRDNVSAVLVRYTA
jgi:protein phosphatase